MACASRAPPRATPPPLNDPSRRSSSRCPTRLPEFDGATYDHDRDHLRLGDQAQRVVDLISDGEWRTLGEIASTTGDPEASVSARLRDLRKPKFGSHEIERRQRHDDMPGLYEYRLARP